MACLHNDLLMLIVSILDIQIPPLAELVVRTDFNLPRITAMSTCDDARSCQIWELVIKVHTHRYKLKSHHTIRDEQFHLNTTPDTIITKRSSTLP